MHFLVYFITFLYFLSRGFVAAQGISCPANFNTSIATCGVASTPRGAQIMVVNALFFPYVSGMTNNGTIYTCGANSNDYLVFYYPEDYFETYAWYMACYEPPAAYIIESKVMSFFGLTSSAITNLLISKVSSVNTFTELRRTHGSPVTYDDSSVTKNRNVAVTCFNDSLTFATQKQRIIQGPNEGWGLPPDDLSTANYNAFTAISDFVLSVTQVAAEAISYNDPIITASVGLWGFWEALQKIALQVPPTKLWAYVSLDTIRTSMAPWKKEQWHKSYEADRIKRELTHANCVKHHGLSGCHKTL